MCIWGVVAKWQLFLKYDKAYQFQVMVGLCPAWGGGVSNCRLYGGLNRNRWEGVKSGCPLGGQSQLLEKIPFNSIAIYSRVGYKQCADHIHNRH